MAEVYCTKCGTKNEEGSKFCLSCGYDFSGIQDSENHSEPETTVPVPQAEDLSKTVNSNKSKKAAKKKNSSLISIIFIAVAACIVLACAGLFCFKFLHFSKQSAKYPGVFYLKDNTLKFNKYGKSDPQKIKGDVFEDEGVVNLPYYNQQFEMSDDGKYILFTTDSNATYNEDDEMILWYMKSNDLEPVKIDDSSWEYCFADNKTVVYRDTDGNLYKYDFKDKEKIDKDVASFEVDLSGKNIFWIDNNGNLYCRPLSLKKDEKKIDKHVDFIDYVSQSSDKIVYIKRDKDGATTLYLSENFESGEKIAADVRDYCVGEEDGEIFVYYVKEASDVTSAFDFIEDDYPNDANLTEPDISDYTSTVVKDSYWGYIESEEVSDEYYERLKEYYEKEDRDTLRDLLRNTPFYLEDLYCYSEKKDDAEKICSGIDDVDVFDYENYSPQIFFSVCDFDSMKKAKLSEVYTEYASSGSYLSDVQNRILECVEEYVAYKDQISPIRADEHVIEIGYDACYSPERGKVYVIGSNEDYTSSTLYEVSFSEKNLGEAKKVAEDARRVFGIYDDRLYYLTNVDRETNTGDLYADGVLIDNDVLINTVSYPKDELFVYYKGGIDSKTDCVDEVYACFGDDPVRIAKDVYTTHVYDKDKIALLTDYSASDKTGTLKLYVGKDKLIKIDTDVSGVIY